MQCFTLCCSYCISSGNTKVFLVWFWIIIFSPLWMFFKTSIQRYPWFHFSFVCLGIINEEYECAIQHPEYSFIVHIIMFLSLIFLNFIVFAISSMVLGTEKFEILRYCCYCYSDYFKEKDSSSNTQSTGMNSSLILN